MKAMVVREANGPFELEQREVKSGGFPYGLRLMVDTLAPTLHGGNPAAVLDIDPALEGEFAITLADGEKVEVRPVFDLVAHQPGGIDTQVHAINQQTADSLRDLLHAIAEGRPATPDFLDGLRASEVVAAVQASAASRSWQAVERQTIA